MNRREFGKATILGALAACLGNVATTKAEKPLDRAVLRVSEDESLDHIRIESLKDGDRFFLVGPEGDPDADGVSKMIVVRDCTWTTALER